VYLDADPARRQLKDADPITPLRTAAIRGHLRFWWRACCGRRFASPEEMRQAEASIWGAASKPGAVSLRLEDAHFDAKDFKVFDMQERNGKFYPRALKGEGLHEIAYGAFPLQPKAGQETLLQPGCLHVFQGSARLVLNTPSEFAQDVRAALRAWLAFGGIGGRTRRGFGAVAATDSADPAIVLKDLGQVQLRTSKQTFRQATDALAFGLGALQRFRQGANAGRNPQSDTTSKKPAGRSRWPEPDTIRHLTGHSSRRHRERQVWGNKFPRAAFGMPIIFHFSDQRDGDPADTTLKPRDAERMASPLILRPYRLKDGMFGCLALVLQADPLRGVDMVLEEKREGQQEGRTWSVQTELTAKEIQAIKPLGGKPDPLSAFLDFFANS
jgi:CRISPR-associated protein Cmr1